MQINLIRGRKLYPHSHRVTHTHACTHAACATEKRVLFILVGGKQHVKSKFVIIIYMWNESTFGASINVIKGEEKFRFFSAVVCSSFYRLQVVSLFNTIMRVSKYYEYIKQTEMCWNSSNLLKISYRAHSIIHEKSRVVRHSITQIRLNWISH